MSESNNDKMTTVKSGESKAVQEGQNKNFQPNRNGGNGRPHNGGYRNHGRRNRPENRYDRNNGENQKSAKENIAQREGGRNIADVPVKRAVQSHGANGETESFSKKNFHENNSQKNDFQHNINGAEDREVHTQRNPKHHKPNFSREAQKHIKVEETREDIIRDIGRIEKEIELEIREISALKFGM